MGSTRASMRGAEPGFDQKAAAQKRLGGGARAYGVSTLSRWMGTSPTARTPQTITVLDPDSSNAQLFVDHVAIRPNCWSWDERDRVLSWRDGAGDAEHAGHIAFTPGDVKGAGMVRVGGNHFSVALDLKPISYTCAVAGDAGAYVTGGANDLTLRWDASSQQWEQAQWVAGTLRFTYGLDGEVVVGQKTYRNIVGFEDLDLGLSWEPEEGEFSALLNSQLAYTFSSTATSTPEDDRTGLPPFESAIKSVFPFLVSFQFDPFGTTLQGAMLTESLSIDGTVYALSGAVDNAAAVGLYRVELDGGEERLLTLHSGKLAIDGEPHPTSGLRGSELHWSNLTPAQVEATGLPAAGSISLSADGGTVLEGSGVRGGRRVSAEEGALAASTAQGLDLMSLLNMSQYTQVNGNWADRFQEESMQDFYEILKHYMDPDLRQQFVSANPPQLEPEVEQIAAMPGSDGSPPGPWYESLSTAYLTKALSSANDPDARTLNAIRATKWMKETVAQASVYRAQAPALYKRRWLLEYLEMGKFLEDQQERSSGYEALIQKDGEGWKEKVAEEVEGAEAQEAMRATIDKVVALGVEGRYWAYCVYRYCTQPSALMILQMYSLNGNSGDGTAYTRRVQTNVALLNLLDPSGAFVQEYMEMVRLFQIGNVLPTLLDYSGDLSKYSYAVTKILEGFVEAYVDSSDPEMQERAREVQEALEQKRVEVVLELFASTASVFVGIYGWQNLAKKFEQSLPKIVNKVPAGVAKLITCAACACGIYGFVVGVKNWDDLDGTEKTALLEGATATFVQIAAALVRRGVAYPAIFSAENTYAGGFKAIFGAEISGISETRVSGGFAKWLVSSGDAEVEVESEMFGNLFSESAEEGLDLVTACFGRNLDSFIATRLGAMFAVVNIVLSSMALAGAKDAEETAADALMVTSASLDLIAAAGGWAVDFGLATIGGLAVTTLVAVVSVVAVLLAIAGIVIMLVEMYRKPPDPIETFAKKQAAEAGLYMPQSAAIDSIQAYQAPGQPQRLGVAFMSDGEEDRCLVLNAGPDSIGPVTNDYDTCLQLATNAYGWAQIGTLAGEGESQRTVLLTCDDGRAVSGVPVLAEQAKASQQQWIAELTGGVTWHEENVEAANFTLYNAYWYTKAGEKLYLRPQGTAVGVGTEAAEWRLALRTMRPAGLTMEDVVLYPDQRDQSFMPYLAQPGSAPRTWSLTPSLPSFLGFDSESGAVSQLPGVAPLLTAKTAFETKVQNEIGEDSAGFTLEVVERPTGAGA